MIYKGVDHLRNPDVQWDPSRRHAPVTSKYTDEQVITAGRCAVGVHLGETSGSQRSDPQGSQWKARTAAHYMHKDEDIGKITAWAAFSPAHWARRREVAANPQSATASGATVAALGRKME